MPRITATISLLMLLVSVNVSAHTRLSGSIPADGAELAAPAEIVFEFSEEVHLTAVSLLSGDTEHELGQLPEGASTKFSVPVAGQLAAGEYSVNWRAVSADTHIVSGDFSFVVVAAPVVEAPAADNAADPEPGTD